MSDGSTIEGLSARSSSEVRAQRRLYAGMTVLLCVIVGLAATDGLGATSVYGVRTSHRTASADGYTLDVRYPSAARPGLAAPLLIEVTAAGGFDGPVTLAVDRSYLRLWDQNGVSPAPSGETTRGEWVAWEFDPPDGDLLVVTLDARIEPGVQASRDGAVQLVIDGETVADVSFTTRVMP